MSINKEIDSKSVIDLYTDWCVSYAATKYGNNFMNRYLNSIASIVKIFNDRLHVDKRKNIDNAYSKTQVSYNDVVNRVYLKGGTSADYHAGTNIKPSDIDCGVVFDDSKYFPTDDDCMYLSNQINDELKWFRNILPGINDHEEFYDLLDPYLNDGKIHIYNSYNDKTTLTISLKDAFTINNKKLLYRINVLSDDLSVVRFYWKTTIVNVNNLDLKINIVDLSMHLCNSTTNLPLLENVNILNNYIWVENIYSILNNQLCLYISGIIRNDKKLIKRKTRTINILNKINKFDIKCATHRNVKNINYINRNIVMLLKNFLKGNDIYPYISLYIPYIAIKNNIFDNIDLYDISLDSLIRPQTAVTSKQYEYYEQTQTRDLVIKDIKKRFQNNKNTLKFIDDYIHTKNINKTEVIVNGMNHSNISEVIVNGMSHNNIPEDDLIKFINTINIINTTYLTNNEIDRIKYLRKLSDNTKRIMIEDGDYEIYNKYLMLNKK